HMNALNTIKLALAGQGRLVLMPQFSPAGYLDAIDHMNALNTIKLALAGQGRLVLMPQFSPAGYLDA
ncbi:hypothetical protein CKW48_21835, partial [Bordetella pertussis]